MSSGDLAWGLGNELNLRHWTILGAAIIGDRERRQRGDSDEKRQANRGWYIRSLLVDVLHSVLYRGYGMS